MIVFLIEFPTSQTVIQTCINPIIEKLTCSIPLKASQAIGIIKEGTIVYVEAVAQHKEHKIMYRVLNQWVPYYYFQLIIQK